MGFQTSREQSTTPSIDCVEGKNFVSNRQGQGAAADEVEEEEGGPAEPAAENAVIAAPPARLSDRDRSTPLPRLSAATGTSRDMETSSWSSSSSSSSSPSATFRHSPGSANATTEEPPQDQILQIRKMTNSNSNGVEIFPENMDWSALEDDILMEEEEKELFDRLEADVRLDENKNLISKTTTVGLQAPPLSSASNEPLRQEQQRALVAREEDIVRHQTLLESNLLISNDNRNHPHFSPNQELPAQRKKQHAGLVVLRHSNPSTVHPQEMEKEFGGSKKNELGLWQQLERANAEDQQCETNRNEEAHQISGLQILGQNSNSVTPSVLCSMDMSRSDSCRVSYFPTWLSGDSNVQCLGEIPVQIRSWALPAFLKGNGEFDLSTQRGIDAILDKIRSHRPLDVRSLIIAKLQPKPREATSLLLRVQGHALAIDLFCKKLDKHLRQQLLLFNFRLLEKHGKVICFNISSLEPLGAHLFQVNKRDGTSCGLWVKGDEDEGSQLARLVGQMATAMGAALISVNGETCTTVNQYQALKESSEGDSFKLELALPPGAIIKESPSVKLVREAQFWPSNENVFCMNGVNTMPTEQDVLAATQWAAAGTGLLQEETSLVHTGGPVGVRRPLEGDPGNMDTLDVPLEHEDVQEPVYRNTSVDTSSSKRHGLKQSRDSAVGTSSKSKQVVTKSGAMGYQAFKERFQEVAKVEFGSSGIHLNAALGEMWKQHKRKYGCDCNKKCNCFRDLPYLTESVVEANLRKNPEWEKPKDFAPPVVGFTGNFAQTYIPLLLSENMNSDPDKLLQRFIEMWKIHRQHRIYGIVCKPTCDCGQGWELHFKKGNLLAGDEYKGCTLKRKGNKTPRSQEPSEPQISRKKLRLGADNVVPTHQQGSTQYTVEITDKEPIGMYFVTKNEKAGNRNTCCKVWSVNSKSKVAKDVRIQRGTIVRAVSLSNGETHMVNDHKNLRKICEDAWLEGKSFQLVLVNTEVESCQLSASFNPSDWNPDGSWAGQIKNGWDGRPSQPPTSVPVAAIPKVTNTLKENYAREEIVSKEEWTVVNKLRPFMKHQPKSIASWATAKKPNVKKNVQITNTFDIRHFDPSAETNIFYVQGMNNSQDDTVPISDLIQATIQSGTYNTLIQQLEEGELNKMKDPVSLLFRWQTHIKEQQEQQMNADSSTNILDLKTSQADLRKKDIVLKVYINAYHALQGVHGLKHFKRMEFQLERIKVIQLDTKGLLCPVHSCKLTVEFTQIFPERKTSEMDFVCSSVMWGSDVWFKSGATVTMYFNRVAEPCRAMKLTIYLEDPNGNRRELGHKEFKLIDLLKACSCVSKSFKIFKEIESTNFKGLVEAKVCTHEVDEKSKEKWKKKYKLKLQQVVQWIQNFNKDELALADGTPLNPNLRTFNARTLLEGAGMLRDKDLEKKLLGLGASYEKAEYGLSARHLGQMEQDDSENNQQASDLPNLSRSWVLTTAPCRYFNTQKGCFKGSHCNFAHVKPVLQQNLREKLSELIQTENRVPPLHGNEFQMNTEVRREVEGNRIWYTAYYKDPVTKTIYCSEGGANGRCNNNDVWWYPDEAAAKAAVRSVVCAWFLDPLSSASLEQE